MAVAQYRGMAERLSRMPLEHSIPVRLRATEPNSNAGVAQWYERLLAMQKAVGSIPITRSTLKGNPTWT